MLFLFSLCLRRAQLGQFSLQLAHSDDAIGHRKLTGRVCPKSTRSELHVLHATLACLVTYNVPKQQ